MNTIPFLSCFHLEAMFNFPKGILPQRSCGEGDRQMDKRGRQPQPGDGRALVKWQGCPKTWERRGGPAHSRTRRHDWAGGWGSKESFASSVPWRSQKGHSLLCQAVDWALQARFPVMGRRLGLGPGWHWHGLTTCSSSPPSHWGLGQGWCFVQRALLPDFFIPSYNEREEKLPGKSVKSYWI